MVYLSIVYQSTITITIDRIDQYLLIFYRCGADPLIEDKQSRTVRDVLINEKPPGWEENLYWLDKFYPGKWSL